jgi:hypothetical protein
MNFLFIDGDVVVPEKLLREHLADMVDAFPDLMVGIVLDKDYVSEAMVFVMDWLERNEVKSYEVDIHGGLAPTPDKVYALIGDKDPDPEVATVLTAALAAGIEVRDLAEAGVTVVRIDGTVPTTPQGEPVADDEVNYTWVELGRFADDDDAPEQKAARETIDEAFTERDLDGEQYVTWLEMAIHLGVEDEEEDAIALSESEEAPAEEPKADKPGFTYEDLKDIGIRKLKEIAKQSKVDPTIGREAIIEALVNGPSQAPPAEEVQGGETFEDRGPAPAAVDEDALADRITAKVLARLRDALA